MKKIIAITASLICAFLLTFQVKAQVKIENVEGNFKGTIEGKEVTFLIKRYTRPDVSGITIQEGKKHPEYFPEKFNRSQRAIYEKGRDYKKNIHYVSQNEFVYTIKTSSYIKRYHFLRVGHEAAVVFYNEIEGKFKEDNPFKEDNYITITKENKGGQQGIRVGGGSRSGYYSRALGNTPNIYILSNYRIQYISNDHILSYRYNGSKFKTTKSDYRYYLRSKEVVKPVVIFDKVTGEFMEIKTGKKLTITGSTRGITVKDAQGRSDYFAPKEGNKYTSSSTGQSIEYVSDNRFKLNNGSVVYYNRLAEKIDYVRVPPATYTFKVDGNDKIKKTALKKGYSEDNFKVTLNVARGITWWKGVKVFDRSGREVCFLTTQDGRKTSSSAMFNKAAFGSRVKVEFWKAKTFGAHTLVATKYYNLSDLAGWNTEFYWQND